MAVNSVPNSKSQVSDKSAPMAGQKKRGPVSTVANEAYSPGVGGSGRRTPAAEERRGNVRTTPKANKF